MKNPLANKLQDNSLILASQSPRRKDLLQGLGVNFKVKPLYADESYEDYLKEEDITNYLCHKKAEAYSFQNEKEILITADTIVWLNDTALEKPLNKEAAKEMLMQLSNTTHKVISSAGLFSMEKQIVFSDTALVTFGTLSKDEVNFYVETYNPLDKAGSYGVQDWIGYIGVKKIEGSYYTIMGLPVAKLYQELLKF